MYVLSSHTRNNLLICDSLGVIGLKPTASIPLLSYDL